MLAFKSSMLLQVYKSTNDYTCSKLLLICVSLYTGRLLSLYSHPYVDWQCAAFWLLFSQTNSKYYPFCSNQHSVSHSLKITYSHIAHSRSTILFIIASSSMLHKLQHCMRKALFMTRLDVIRCSSMLAGCT